MHCVILLLKRLLLILLIDCLTVLTPVSLQCYRTIILLFFLYYGQAYVSGRVALYVL